MRNFVAYFLLLFLRLCSQTMSSCQRYITAFNLLMSIGRQLIAFPPSFYTFTIFHSTFQLEQVLSNKHETFLEAQAFFLTGLFAYQKVIQLHCFQCSMQVICKLVLPSPESLSIVAVIYSFSIPAFPELRVTLVSWSPSQHSHGEGRVYSDESPAHRRPEIAVRICYKPAYFFGVLLL